MDDCNEKIDFEVLECHYTSVEKHWENDPSQLIRESIPYYFRIFYIVDGGKAYYSRDDKIIEYKVGNLYIMAPNKRYNFYYEKNNPVTIIALHVLLKNVNINHDFIEIDVEDNINSNQYKQILELIKFFILESPNTRGLHSATELLMILINNSYGELRKNQPWLDYLLEYIRNNLDKSLTNTELAKQTGYNPKYLLRTFQKNMGGVTLHQYVLAEKVRKAQYFLAQGVKVGIVSELLGFSEPKVFSRTFKQISNSTPTEYQEKFKIKEN